MAIKIKSEMINKKRKIDCDFEEKSAYIYSLDKTEKLVEKVEASKKAGIEAEFVKESFLPFHIEGAVKFNNQAQFNPLKFLKVISEELVIYENTRAMEIKEKEVVTDKGIPYIGRYSKNTPQIYVATGFNKWGKSWSL